MFKMGLYVLRGRKKRWSAILTISFQEYIFLTLLVKVYVKISHLAIVMLLRFIHWKVVFTMSFLVCPFIDSLERSHLCYPHFSENEVQTFTKWSIYIFFLKNSSTQKFYLFCIYSCIQSFIYISLDLKYLFYKMPHYLVDKIVPSLAIRNSFSWLPWITAIARTSSTM